MKKFIIMSFVLMFMLSSMALASNTRVNSMGLGSSITVIDDANIAPFPSRLKDFNNLAIGEFDSNDFTEFGMIWKINEDAKWNMGAFFSTDLDYEMFGVLPNFGLYPTYYNKRINLLYGREMGNNYFGAGINYRSAGIEESDTLSTNNDDKESLSNIDITLSLTEGSGQWDVAASIGFGSFTNEVNDTLIQNEADGISRFGIVGRYFKQHGPNYTLIPHAGIMIEKFGWKDPNAPTFNGQTVSEKYTMSTIDLGLGFNYSPSNNVLAVFDVGIMLDSWKNEYTEYDLPNTTNVTYEDKYTTTTIPYFRLGLDAEVFKWLDVRMGVMTDWHREKQKEDEPWMTEDKLNYSYSETSIGLGFHWGRLHVDTYTDPEFFLNGPYFINGSGEDDYNNNLAGAISVTYEL